MTLKTGMAVLAALTALPPPVLADGFHTCLLPQEEIATKTGVERPSARAYDSICMAVLPPGCRDYTVDRKPCAYRACAVPETLRSCPNGDPVVFTAATIEPYVAKTVKPITREEMAAMNRALDAEAKRIAAEWTDNGRVPLSPAAITVIQNVSCQMVAFGNPDVRCVPR